MMVFDKSAPSLTTGLPGSILKMQDGTYQSASASRRGRPHSEPKSFGRADGALQGTGSTEIDTSALWTASLTGPMDATVRGHTSKLALHSLPAVLKPVVASPFAELTLEAHGGSPVCKPVDEALRLCGISWRAWGRAAPMTTILVDGLPDVAAARAA